MKGLGLLRRESVKEQDAEPVSEVAQCEADLAAGRSVVEEKAAERERIAAALEEVDRRISGERDTSARENGEAKRKALAGDESALDHARAGSLADLRRGAREDQRAELLDQLKRAQEAEQLARESASGAADALSKTKVEAERRGLAASIARRRQALLDRLADFAPAFSQLWVDVHRAGVANDLHDFQRDLDSLVRARGLRRVLLHGAGGTAPVLHVAPTLPVEGGRAIYEETETLKAPAGSVQVLP